MTTFDKIESIARSQIGYREGGGRVNNNDQKYSDELPGFDWSDGQPWCATFVNWVFWKAGVWELIPAHSASCDFMGDGWKKIDRWSEYPAKGAQVFFGYPHDLNHTGIVVDFDKDYIYTVEGNTNNDGSREGDGVYLKKRERRGANVIGYGYPKFAEGIVSADPAYADEAPAPVPVSLPTVSLSAVQKAGKVAAWSHALPNKGVRRDVALLVAALKAEGVRTYRQWQIRCEVEPTNGIPDLKSLTRLGKRNGFRVVE